MKTARFFWFYFKRYKWSFIGIFLAIVLSTYLQVKAPIYMGQALADLGIWVQDYYQAKAVSEATGTKLLLPEMTAFYSVMTKLFWSYLFITLASLIYSLLFTRIVSHSTSRMRKGLFGKLERLTIQFF